MALWIACGILLSAIAYMFGAIPTGYWLGKLLKGIDIREHGSKSTGATNVLRTMGKLPALATLLVDLLKGFAAVLFASWIYSLPSVLAATAIGISPENTRPWAMASAALLAVAGHSRSIWLRFTGGKSAATGLGALLAMAWPVGLGVAVIFAFVLTISRIVSLSSISAAIAALVLMVSLHQPNAFVLMALVGAAYVIWRHGANIQRLLAGTEPRIGQS